MMTTFSLMNIPEDFLPFLWFDTALKHICDASLVYLTIDNGEGFCSSLHLSGRDLITRQTTIHHVGHDWLCPRRHSMDSEDGFVDFHGFDRHRFNRHWLRSPRVGPSSPRD